MGVLENVFYDTVRNALGLSQDPWPERLRLAWLLLWLARRLPILLNHKVDGDSRSGQTGHSMIVHDVDMDLFKQISQERFAAYLEGSCRNDRARRSGRAPERLLRRAFGARRGSAVEPMAIIVASTRVSARPQCIGSIRARDKGDPCVGSRGNIAAGLSSRTIPKGRSDAVDCKS